MTIRLLPEVSFALREGTPVVALESSVLAQGLPVPSNREAAIRMTTAVRAHGAIPAITAVARGVPTVGLDDDELERFLARDGVIKVSARDIPVAVIRESDGATTVAAALLLARQAGVTVFATGGIGGVHRQPSFDESADLLELSRSPMVVVCAGAKAILDLPATFERLESLGVLVVGYCTDELPGFFTATTGLRLSARADSPADIAAIFRAHRALGRESAILVVQPPPSDAALPRKVVDAAVSDALERAQREGVRGASVTPYLLDAVQRATGGKSLGANLSLLEANAALAAEIAVALRQESGVARQEARGGG